MNSARNMDDTYYDPWSGQIYSIAPVAAHSTQEKQVEMYNYSMGWMGKGKGMMKGGKGGKPWSPPMGKGGPNTECYNCGGKGHIAINCPKGKGKGKGRKGKNESDKGNKPKTQDAQQDAQDVPETLDGDSPKKRKKRRKRKVD